MPAGFQVFTPNGNIQFTEEFSNFVLVGKGVTTLGAPWVYISTTGGPFTTITVPDYYGYPPLIAVVCQQNIYLRDAVRDGNGNWVFGVAGAYQAPQGAQIEWFAFGPPHAGLPRLNYGFEIFKQNGQIAYSSAWKPLRIVGEINNAGASQWNGPGGRKYGVAHVLEQFSQSSPIPAGTWRVQGSGSFHQTVGTQITLNSGQIYSTIWGVQPPFPTEYHQPNARHLVVDLTDY